MVTDYNSLWGDYQGEILYKVTETDTEETLVFYLQNNHHFIFVHAENYLDYNNMDDEKTRGFFNSPHHLWFGGLVLDWFVLKYAQIEKK